MRVLSILIALPLAACSVAATVLEQSMTQCFAGNTVEVAGQAIYFAPTGTVHGKAISGTWRETGQKICLSTGACISVQQTQCEIGRPVPVDTWMGRTTALIRRGDPYSLAPISVRETTATPSQSDPNSAEFFGDTDFEVGCNRQAIIDKGNEINLRGKDQVNRQNRAANARNPTNAFGPGAGVFTLKSIEYWTAELQLAFLNDRYQRCPELRDELTPAIRRYEDVRINAEEALDRISAGYQGYTPI